MKGCVYLFHALTTNYYKIGRTTNIKKRMGTIQSQVPFFEIKLIATHYHKKYKEIERRLHWVYGECRLKGSEWFELSDDDIATIAIDTSDLVIYLGLDLPIKENDKAVSRECKILGGKIFRLYRELGTWERVGWSYGLPKIVLWRIVHDGYEPQNSGTRHTLGLPVIETQEVHRNNLGRYSERS